VTPQSPLLLSIKPQHVSRILDGSKTVELRRRGWADAVGRTALLYSTWPERALVGSFVVAKVDVRSPSAIWRKYGELTGLTKREFDDYFDDAKTAVAIATSKVRRLLNPLTLDELRQRHPQFLVPQSYRYVGPEELGQLLNGERQQLFG
jgi:predicted transcriptional regulator